MADFSGMPKLYNFGEENEDDYCSITAINQRE